MIFIIWLLILFFIICFFKFAKKYSNPYKLVMVFGKKGSGKTTLLTKIALKNYKKGISVYSTIDIPGTKKFNVEDIGKYQFEPNSVVLIDEVGMIWDNRKFKAFSDDVRDFFKLQRQYKVTVYLFSQSFDIDKKLRDLTDLMYLVSIKANVFSVAKRISKNVTIVKAQDGTSRLDEDYKFMPFFMPQSRIYTWVPRWVPYFKSYDPKPLPNIKYSDLVMNSIQIRYLSTKQYLIDIVLTKFKAIKDKFLYILFSNRLIKYLYDKWIHRDDLE